MHGSRDICRTIIRGLVTGHVMTCSGAVDSTQAATSLPDLAVGRRKDLLMRYPRDQCKLASDRLPTRDAARTQSSRACLAHRRIHKHRSLAYQQPMPQALRCGFIAQLLCWRAARLGYSLSRPVWQVALLLSRVGGPTRGDPRARPGARFRARASRWPRTRASYNAWQRAGVASRAVAFLPAV